jgi:hypothetical protein
VLPIGPLPVTTALAHTSDINGDRSTAAEKHPLSQMGMPGSTGTSLPNRGRSPSPSAMSIPSGYSAGTSGGTNRSVPPAIQKGVPGVGPNTGKMWPAALKSAYHGIAHNK